MTTITKPRTFNKELWVYIINALFITNILFFLDEGYYDLRWMGDFGNWIVFVFYAAAILGVQLLIAYGALGWWKAKNNWRTFFTVTGTILSVFVLVFTLFTRT